jgi:hypothetical protein
MTTLWSMTVIPHPRRFLAGTVQKKYLQLYVSLCKLTIPNPRRFLAGTVQKLFAVVLFAVQIYHTTSSQTLGRYSAKNICNCTFRCANLLYHILTDSWQVQCKKYLQLYFSLCKFTIQNPRRFSAGTVNHFAKIFANVLFAVQIYYRTSSQILCKLVHSAKIFANVLCRCAIFYCALLKYGRCATYMHAENNLRI